MCIEMKEIHVLRGPVWELTPVPCKECWQCKSNRVNDFVGRCLAEAAYSEWTVSVTLTYAPRGDLAEQVITPSHFQDAIRALRKRGHNVRYLVAGEYGEAKGRAHFHAILFGMGQAPNIKHKQNDYNQGHWWPHGHVFADWTATEGAIRYVIKYLNKYEGTESWHSLSKKPILGYSFIMDKAQQNIEADVFPSRMLYQPPGGQDREYMLTGASRDEYLLAIADGLQWTDQQEKRRLSEWALRSLTAARKRRHIKSAPKQSYIEFRDELLARQLDAALSFRYQRQLEFDTLAEQHPDAPPVINNRWIYGKSETYTTSTRPSPGSSTRATHDDNNHGDGHPKGYRPTYFKGARGSVQGSPYPQSNSQTSRPVTKGAIK